MHSCGYARLFAGLGGLKTHMLPLQLVRRLQLFLVDEHLAIGLDCNSLRRRDVMMYFWHLILELIFPHHCDTFSPQGVQALSLRHSGKRTRKTATVCTLSPELRPVLSTLYQPFHPSHKVIPGTAPGPSHQPARNWIMLTSVVVLPTFTKTNTHKKVLERKAHSAAHL